MKVEGHRRPRVLRQDKTIRIYMRAVKTAKWWVWNDSIFCLPSWNFVGTSSLYKLLNAYFIVSLMVSSILSSSPFRRFAPWLALRSRDHHSLSMPVSYLSLYYCTRPFPLHSFLVKYMSIQKPKLNSLRLSSNSNSFLCLSEIESPNILLILVFCYDRIRLCYFLNDIERSPRSVRVVQTPPLQAELWYGLSLFIQ